MMDETDNGVVEAEQTNLEELAPSAPVTTATDSAGTEPVTIKNAQSVKKDSPLVASQSAASSQDTFSQEAVESENKSVPSEGWIPNLLSSWGPWKRWTWYRKMQREERLSLWQERDPEENEQGRLPDEESVQVPAIWIAELYTPSEIDGLFKGIKSLGWEHGKSRGESLLEWMSNVRQGRDAGWKSLGLVSHPRAPYISKERTAELPTGVAASLPVVISLTPSTTALVMAFLLDDEASKALDKPIREYYITYTERQYSRRDIVRYLLFNNSMVFSRRICGPDHQRHSATRSCLKQVETDCSNWIRTNLPGVFASGLRGGIFPSAVLLVTEVTAPATEDARSISAFRGLSIDRYFDAWKSDKWPGGRLILPRSWDENAFRLTFSCRRYDAFPNAPGYHDPGSNWTIAQRADDMIRGLISRWSLTILLDGYHERLSKMRDQSATEKSYRLLRDMKQLRSLTRTKLYDIVASSQEIQEFTEEDRSYRYNVLEMEYVRPTRDEQMQLIEVLMSSQRKRAQQVLREANLLQSVLSVSSEVSQMIANIQIQWLVVILTIISIGIAVLALFVSLRSIP